MVQVRRLCDWFSSNAIWLEYAILYALGIGVIWFGGRVQHRVAPPVGCGRERRSARAPLPS